LHHLFIRLKLHASSSSAQFAFAKKKEKMKMFSENVFSSLSLKIEFGEILICPSFLLR
jgi:hypothetical protein